MTTPDARAVEKMDKLRTEDIRTDENSAAAKALAINSSKKGRRSSKFAPSLGTSQSDNPGLGGVDDVYGTSDESSAKNVEGREVKQVSEVSTLQMLGFLFGRSTRHNSTAHCIALH